MMGTEMAPEMLVVFNKLTWLIAQKDFMDVNHHENIIHVYLTFFGSYIVRLKYTSISHLTVVENKPYIVNMQP
jgi:hypothetical protein